MERGRRCHLCKKDGSAECAAAQGMRPSLPRIFGLLRWHTHCRLAGTGTCRERQAKYSAGKHESEKEGAFSWGFLNQKIQLFGKCQVTSRQLVERSIHGFAAGHYNDVPAGLKLCFIQPIDLPDPPPGAVTDMGLAQFLADGDAHPVAFGTVLPGIEHQQTIRRTPGVVQPLKNVIQFQRTRKLHTIIPKKSQASSMEQIVDGAARDFVANESSGPQEYFVYFKGFKSKSWGKRSGIHRKEF